MEGHLRESFGVKRPSFGAKAYVHRRYIIMANALKSKAYPKKIGTQERKGGIGFLKYEKNKPTKKSDKNKSFNAALKESLIINLLIL